MLPQQVAAHQVAAVVALAETLELTVREGNRLQHREEGFTKAGLPLPDPAVLIDLQLVPQDEDDDSSEEDGHDGDQPASIHGMLRSELSDLIVMEWIRSARSLS